MGVSVVHSRDRSTTTITTVTECSVPGPGLLTLQVLIHCLLTAASSVSHEKAEGWTVPLRNHQKVFLEASDCVRSWATGAAFILTEGKFIQVGGNGDLNFTLRKKKVIFCLSADIQTLRTRSSGICGFNPALSAFRSGLASARRENYGASGQLLPPSPKGVAARGSPSEHPWGGGVQGLLG